MIKLAESKLQGINKSEKHLADEKVHKNHLESFYTSRPLSKLIQQANSLSLSSNQQDNISINNLSASQFFWLIKYYFDIYLFFTLIDDVDDGGGNRNNKKFKLFITSFSFF